jgi:hypothetical protein
MADTVNSAILVNGANRDAAHVTIGLLGAARPGVKSISYNFERPSENNYGLGAEPVSYGYGAKKYTGLSIEWFSDELEAIENAAPNGDITAIPPFQVKITWTPDSLNVKGRVVTLKNVRFTGRNEGVKIGDTLITCTTACQYAGIDFNSI